MRAGDESAWTCIGGFQTKIRAHLWLLELHTNLKDRRSQVNHILCPQEKWR